MTLDDFQAFKESCYQRGLTTVKVSSGWLDLEHWHPYGAFGGSNPGIERHIGGFKWISNTQAVDYPPEGSKDVTGVCGCWTFGQEETDEVLDEQHANYNRMIGESLRR